MGLEEVSISAKEKSGKITSNNITLFLMALLVVGAVAYGLEPRLKRLEDADARIETLNQKLLQQHDEQLRQNGQLIEEIRKISAFATNYSPLR